MNLTSTHPPVRPTRRVPGVGLACAKSSGSSSRLKCLGLPAPSGVRPSQQMRPPPPRRVAVPDNDMLAGLWRDVPPPGFSAASATNDDVAAPARLWPLRVTPPPPRVPMTQATVPGRSPETRRICPLSR